MLYIQYNLFPLICQGGESGFSEKIFRKVIFADYFYYSGNIFIQIYAKSAIQDIAK